MKKKIERSEKIVEINESVTQLSDEDKLFVDKSMEIAHFISVLLETKNLKQKDLAVLMGKSEAEISKLLGGMHNFTLRTIAKIEAALGEKVIYTPREKLVQIKFTEHFSPVGITKMNIHATVSEGLNYSNCKVIPMMGQLSENAEQKVI
ncbi:helix-turn-helix transcriptional regulator [Flavihumibacter sp. RY-1]|uniref:Helix-turn-helix transcriptional regulator n=1 Tax=Flavihumibacter fluminis TaxID=2909236 RepID=A0ABS9BHQ5_9BACT|nr:helix-turn-helix transcriptional regulator [Flavihumibacter fluminis]MCF1715236.1 helix-turn-helix transcriptional regulator [Flavihumibacter fluminis]